MANDQRDESHERVVELLEELVKWTRVTSIPDVRKLLVETLRNDTDKLAYHNSDGKRTSREVGDIVKLGKDAIASRWKSWTRLGIAEPISVKGGGTRAKRLFSLDSFGITIPVLEYEGGTKAKLQPEDDNNE